MATPTSKENLARIEKMFNDIQLLLSNLYGRWLDEREYEDINSYSVVLEKIMPDGLTIVKMNKKPFGFNFRIEGFDAEYQMFCKSGSIGWKRLK